MKTPQIRFRSIISFPPRSQLFNAKNLESDLQKLQSWELPKALPQTPEAIQSGLMGLAEVYNAVNKLIAQSPSTQKSLILQHGKDSKTTEESLLETSVELLDSCNTIRELLQMIKDHVQALQSALRRKGLDSTVQNDIVTYLCFRRKTNKCVVKSLKKLKLLEHKNGLMELHLPVDKHRIFIVVLKKVALVAIAIFKCILLLLSWPTARHKSWSLVYKVMIAKSVASGRENGVMVSEMGIVDFALSSLEERIRSNCAKSIDLKMVQNRLQNVDGIVQGLDVGLEMTFRQLVQSRVALLNLITDH